MGLESKAELRTSLCVFVLLSGGDVHEEDPI